MTDQFIAVLVKYAAGFLFKSTYGIKETTSNDFSFIVVSYTRST